ncbi:MAG: hypothetical protein RLY31_1475 [Bacteroidota bacterium]|jgi:hypothetical protein
MNLDMKPSNLRFLVRTVLFLTCLLPAALPAQPGDPAARAERLTLMMQEKLSLSGKQLEKVREINNRYAAKQAEAWQNAAGDREAVRRTMGTLREEKDKELKKVLTAAQYEQYEAMEQALRNQRGEGRRQGGSRSEGAAGDGS